MTSTTFGNLEIGSFFKLNRSKGEGMRYFAFKKVEVSHAEIVCTINDAPKEYEKYVGESRFLQQNTEVITIWNPTRGTISVGLSLLYFGIMQNYFSSNIVHQVVQTKKSQKDSFIFYTDWVAELIKENEKTPRLGGALSIFKSCR